MIDAAAMEVQRERPAPVPLWPAIAQVDHEPAVGMTAARARGGVTDTGFADGRPGFAGIPVKVVRSLFHQLILMLTLLGQPPSFSKRIVNS